MKAKRVRFKDSENEPNHPGNCRCDVCSAASDAKEDLPTQPAASNEPKTSEFSYFKKLKQDVGRSSCRNPLDREGNPRRNLRPSNYSRNLGKSKFDVKSSQYVKNSASGLGKPKLDEKSSQYVNNSATGESGSYLSPKDAALESSAIPSKEHDSQRFKCSSLVKTPTSLDLVLSTTANGSVNPESQQKDGDIFSSKRLKLLHRVAKTLFPDADEVPKECNLVLLLLSRLLPESSQELPSKNLQLKQPETKEKCQLHLDSNIQFEDSLNTRELVKANKDHFLDNTVVASAAQSHRFWNTLLSGQTVEDSNASTRYFDTILLGHSKGNEQGSFPNGIGYGFGSESFGDRNLLTWGNELYDYSTRGNTTSNILGDEACKQFSHDAYDSSWSCKFRDCSHSYEFYDGNRDSFTSAKSSSLAYKDGIHDFNLDRGPQFSLSSWCDSSSHGSVERCRPSTFNNLRDYTEPNCLNDLGIRRELCPRLIGWNTDELNVHDSAQTTQPRCQNDDGIRKEFCGHLIGWKTDDLNVHDTSQSTHMEIEIYHPPSFTSSQDLRDSPKLEIYHPPSSTWSEDPWVGPEKRNLLHLSPYSSQDHDIQGPDLQQKALVPRSPIPLKLSYGEEQLNQDDSGLSISKSSNIFYISQKGWSTENMMSETTTLEAFPYLPKIESNPELKSKSITGFLMEHYDKCTDDVLALSRPGYSSSQFLLANECNLAISQSENQSLTSLHVSDCHEDFLPLQCHTLKWKDS